MAPEGAVQTYSLTRWTDLYAGGNCNLYIQWYTELCSPHPAFNLF